jgi:signal transduction histidine kinase
VGVMTARSIVADDRFLRIALTALFIVVVAVQLLTGHTATAAVAWSLFVPTVLLSVWTLLPDVERTPTSRTARQTRVVLCALYAVVAGLLFPVPAHTVSAGFVYLAALAAGQLLESRRSATVVAVIASVTAAGAAFAVDTVEPLSWPCWLGLSAGLPVLYGIARRERAMAADALRRAVLDAERARSSESREAALLERARIAHEIHDVLGHSLAAISIQLDLADALYGVDRPAESIAAVRRARSLARSGIGETKRAVQALQEDAPSLAESVQIVAYSFGAAFSVHGQAPPLDVPIAQALIRATREALSNAHRHAPETWRSVALTFSGPTDPAVALVVRNGLPTGAQHRHDTEGNVHVGLQGMRERAELLRGTVTAGPDHESGDPSSTSWTLTMRLPL